MKQYKRKQLVEALKTCPEFMSQKLGQLKAESKQIERDDFIWHFILQSFATMGNSRGHAGLIKNPDNYNRVTFQEISRLRPGARFSHFKLVLGAAGVRYSEQKAGWLCKNFDFINSLGGLVVVKSLALSQKGQKFKINFMKKFSGIGDKYARNIFMDVYHPDFHDSIAIDQRINEITAALGYSFDNYEEHEKFYLEIAREAGLNGWELDRLLYNYKEYFLNSILR